LIEGDLEVFNGYALSNHEHLQKYASK